MQIVLNLPQDIAELLTTKWADLPRAALESLALESYRSGALTHAQMCRLLGFESRGEVEAFLKQHGVYLEHSPDDVQRDTESSRLVSEVAKGALRHDLDHLAGRWSEQEYRDITEAVREQRQIDPKMWK